MKINKIFFAFVLALFIFVIHQSRTDAQNRINSKLKDANKSNVIKEAKSETEEEKAIRLAEEFIKRNGYTSADADKKNLSFESLEFFNDTEEILKLRKNSLEAKAFGVSPHGIGKEKGWTVVFRYNKSIYKDFSEENYNTHGRAVTMDENFKDLRVQHKDFILNRVEKKIQ